MKTPELSSKNLKKRNLNNWREDCSVYQNEGTMYL